MEQLETIFQHYGLDKEDQRRLGSLRPIIEENADDCIAFLHRSVQGLGDQTIVRTLNEHPHLTTVHRAWLVEMFRGEYGKPFFDRLKKIGKTHLKKGVTTHSVSLSMNYVRGFLIDLLSAHIDDKDHRTQLKKSIHKMIDISLDIITNSYMEEEIQILSAGYRVRGALVGFAEKFASGMNLVLVLALILITLGVVGLFAYDLSHLVTGDNISHGIITLLGTLLILWVMIELMNTEIAHLKGGKFNISVFIGVALVTFIRDLMIVTLKHEQADPNLQSYFLGVIILILGLVYWLVVRAEARK